MTQEELNNILIASYKQNKNAQIDKPAINYLEGKWRKEQESPKSLDLRNLISDLNDDSKAELIALMSLGKSTFNNFADALDDARALIKSNKYIIEYLMNMEGNMFDYIMRSGNPHELIGL